MDKKNQIIREAELIKFKPVVESGEAMKSSAFKSVYQNVAKELEKICKEQQSIIDDEKKKSEIVFKKGKSQPNIIMLHGDRGSGKTSCMISIVNELVKDKSERKLFENINVESFKTIELIDPSEFEEESNILHIIIGELFKRFKGDVENGNKQISQDDKRLIIKKFEEIFDAIKVLSKNKSLNGDSQLDYLIEMSDALNLSDKINVLIKEYLRIIYDSEGTQRLIIPIDDMDLNSKYAYQMLEQIRKYFMIPRVVFIIASKLEQLKLDIKQNFYKDYEKIIKQENNFDVVVDEMASKYIEKLIPASRRIELPSLYEIIGDQVKLEIAEEEELELEEYLIKKIYDKTHIYFKKGELYPSRIVPENLREFGGLINLLNNMCDSWEERVQNREQFKKYFLNSWIPTHLSTGKARIVNEIYTKPVKEKNKFVVQAIEKELKFLARIQQKEKDGTATKQYDPTVAKLEYLKIIDEENYAKAISLGDILLVLSFADQYLISKEDLDFTFAVRTVYSFNLLDEYQKIKDEERNQTITGYDHLINGSVKNTAVYKFFNYGQNFKITDDMKFMDYSLTQKYINLGLLVKALKRFYFNDAIKIREEIKWTGVKLKSYKPDEINEIIIKVENKIRGILPQNEEDASNINDCGRTLTLIIIEMMLTMIIDQTGGLRDNERKSYRKFCNDFSVFGKKQSLNQMSIKHALWDVTGHFSFLYHYDLKRTPEYSKYTWEQEPIHDMFESLLGPLSLKKMMRNQGNKKFYVGNIEVVENIFNSISSGLSKKYKGNWTRKIYEYLESLMSINFLEQEVYDSFIEMQCFNVWRHIFSILSDDKNKIEIKIGEKVSSSSIQLNVFLGRVIEGVEWKKIDSLEKIITPTSAKKPTGLTTAMKVMIEGINEFNSNNELNLKVASEIADEINGVLEFLTYHLESDIVEKIVETEGESLKADKKVIEVKILMEELNNQKSKIKCLVEEIKNE